VTYFGIKLYIDLTVAKKVSFLEDDNNPEKIYEFKEFVFCFFSLSFFARAILQFPVLALYSEKNQLKNFFRSEMRTSRLVTNSSYISDSIFHKCFRGIVKFYLFLMIKVSLENNSRKQIGYLVMRSRKHPRSIIGILFTYPKTENIVIASVPLGRRYTVLLI